MHRQSLVQYMQTQCCALYTHRGLCTIHIHTPVHFLHRPRSMQCTQTCEIYIKANVCRYRHFQTIHRNKIVHFTQTKPCTLYTEHRLVTQYTKVDLFTIYRNRLVHYTQRQTCAQYTDRDLCTTDRHRCMYYIHTQTCEICRDITLCNIHIPRLVHYFQTQYCALDPDRDLCTDLCIMHKHRLVH